MGKLKINFCTRRCVASRELTQSRALSTRDVYFFYAQTIQYIPSESREKTSVTISKKIYKSFSNEETRCIDRLWEFTINHCTIYNLAKTLREKKEKSIRLFYYHPICNFYSYIYMIYTLHGKWWLLFFLIYIDDEFYENLLEIIFNFFFFRNIYISYTIRHYFPLMKVYNWFYMIDAHVYHEKETWERKHL